MPEASDVTVKTGWSLLPRTSMDVPFHCEANIDHHLMSEHAATFRRRKSSIGALWYIDALTVQRSVLGEQLLPHAEGSR